MKRDEVIDKLVCKCIDSVMSDHINYGDTTWIGAIFEEGHFGFTNYTNERLESEWYETFEERIKRDLDK